MDIKRIDWQDTLVIRHQVLWPDKSIEFCKVLGDESAQHFGVYIENKLVSVASLFTEKKYIQLRKFATLEAYQGKGIGSGLLTHLIEYAKTQNANYFWCDARKASKSFYVRFGMSVEGEAFSKYDEPYYKMLINLS